MAGASHTPAKGGNPTTPDLAVVAQHTADTSLDGCDVQSGYTQAERHSLTVNDNDQRDVSEAQLQGRDVPPASWAAAKRDLTWTPTTQLKSYLKILSVIGVSNAVNKLKIDAVAARVQQHRVSLCCLEDA
jgi:hypothetical protein